MLDLDDGHRSAAGHPGAAVIPAVFATADGVKASDDDVLTAIALGYEIGVRISASRDFSRLRTLASGLWCGIGAAAAAAYLRGLPVEQVANALAIAATSAPNQSAAPFTRVMGNNVKEGIPWATATGLTAVELAAAGFSGPIDMFDEGDRYDREVLTNGLGASWCVERAYFKPYSCCRWAHAAIDGLVQILGEEGVSTEQIRSISVETFARALTLNNEVAPRTLEGAQYSIPFCLALVAVRGPRSLLPLKLPVLEDQRVIDLAQRISLHCNPELDKQFPATVPARISVAIRDRWLQTTITVPKGDPDNPMTWNELLEKFAVVAATVLGERAASRFRGIVAGLEHGNIRSLRDLLTENPGTSSR